MRHLETRGGWPYQLRSIGLALAALAALIAFGMASPLLAYTVDDSFITFRYAEHVGTGLGPVFNVGEGVEGYASFLWMLLMAGSFMFWIAAAMARALWEERRGCFPWSSLLLGVAALTHPEGMVFFAVTGCRKEPALLPGRP